MPNIYVSAAKASKLVSYGSLLHWKSLGFVPTDSNGHYPLEYLQRLARFSTIGKIRAEQAHLCMLEWLSHHKPEMRAEISKITTEMLKNGNLLDTLTAANLFGYDKRTVNLWAKKGFIPACIVYAQYPQPLNVFLVKDVYRVKTVLDGLTSYEAAERLGISVVTCNKLTAQGKIQATMTPSGWRFSPAAIEAYLETRRRPEGMLLAEALQALGVKNEVEFRPWVRSGAITRSKKGRHYLYSPQSVLRAKAEREKLRGDFEWLGATHLDPTYTPKTVARRLGVAGGTINTWARAGLLPYFNLSPPGSALEHQRHFVAAYINGFMHFLGQRQQSASQPLARDFKEIMRRRCST